MAQNCTHFILRKKKKEEFGFNDAKHVGLLRKRKTDKCYSLSIRDINVVSSQAINLFCP